MPIQDKKNVLSHLSSLNHVALELGCGSRKQVPDAIGIDLLDYQSVDIVGDIYEVLQAFPKLSVDAVYSYHFVEHVPDVGLLMDELARVLKPEAQVEIVAPHFSNPYFFSDYTHRNFFGLYTFCYLADSQLFSRQVPTYKRTAEFKLTDVTLEFKSTRPFIFRHIVKKAVGKIVNLTTYTKEFYEENFCYIFPCYEIKYNLIKNMIPLQSDLLVPASP